MIIKFIGAIYLRIGTLITQSKLKIKEHYFLKWAIPSLFFYIFVFSIQLTVYVQYNFLLMTGFEPRTSGIRSDRSTN